MQHPPFDLFSDDRFVLDLPAPFVVAGQVDDIALIAVDQVCFTVLDDPRAVAAVVHMDMAVEQVPGMVFLQELPEGLEAAVWQVIVVAVVADRRVGQDDVRALVPPELETQPADALSHLAFGVLVIRRSPCL